MALQLWHESGIPSSLVHALWRALERSACYLDTSLDRAKQWQACATQWCRVEVAQQGQQRRGYQEVDCGHPACQPDAGQGSSSDVSTHPSFREEARRRLYDLALLAVAAKKAGKDDEDVLYDISVLKFSLMLLQPVAKRVTETRQKCDKAKERLE